MSKFKIRISFYQGKFQSWTKGFCSMANKTFDLFFGTPSGGLQLKAGFNLNLLNLFVGVQIDYLQSTIQLGKSDGSKVSS